MISEFLLDVVFNIATFFLDRFNIGNISWDVSGDMISPFFSIVQSICYFLPVGTISAIIALIVAFGIVRIVIRLIITFWDLLPLV